MKTLKLIRRYDRSRTIMSRLKTARRADERIVKAMTRYGAGLLPLSEIERDLLAMYGGRA